ncbi:MAG TPA: hypothetical protein VGR91_09285 [Stellaceae bacterium]|nr:hypothetical protein [Stellaceae bacterium]
MIIRDLTAAAVTGGRAYAATIAWEDADYPEQQFGFEIHDGAQDAGDPPADAFLAGCYPLACVHAERRLRIEAEPCPMLIEGLYTVHAWWASWGGMPSAAPAIEARRVSADGSSAAPRHGIAFISGGVDSLHLLLRNRRLYRQSDPAYIREALFIHGFDIGKRQREPEEDRFRAAFGRLAPVADETGLRLVACRTTLRQLPSKPGFWTHRHNVGALAAVGHAAARGAAFLLVAGGYHLENPVPMGTHPAVDGLYSSQRVTVVHEGARFRRLDKIRDLANWPTALATLRVCPAATGEEMNCRICEKCLSTRLELLAAGIDETPALGPSLTPLELWEAAVPVPLGHRALRYQDLLAPLRARGYDALCRMLEQKIAIYRRRVTDGLRWPDL